MLGNPLSDMKIPEDSTSLVIISHHTSRSVLKIHESQVRPDATLSDTAGFVSRQFSGQC